MAGPHKKHVNSSGQTLVARACQSGKLEAVKQRLGERPEDLDEVDFAENTPLHTASISGYEDIVQYLLEAGCSVDPVNVARDTPLHDAIDNGHLDVVRLLLDAGANPRKANGKGEEPYDLVDDDCDVADEIRDAILAAKNKTNDRRSSEDEQMHDNTDSRLSHPRQSPSMQPSDSMPTGSRKNTTTRSIKTSDRVLYQPLNVAELRKAAAENDTNLVVRILDVHNNKIDDAKSLIIAAKAGHQDVINLLFGYGQFNPDPDPIKTQSAGGAESATPILAAIGRDNLEVIELFLNQPNFDPTRRINGETYYEIAKKRAGSVWKEEEALLRDAFDKYKKTNKSSPNKPRSPGLRRDAREDRDSKRAVRKDEQRSPRSHKRSTSSPKSKESESSKSLQRSSSSVSQLKEGQNSSKKGPARPKRDEGSSTAISDRETTPLGPPKQKSHARRSESDVVASSENETAAKPRRKLVSGKEFRGERELEKQRRTSIASTTSSTSVIDRREGESKSEKAARKTSPSISRISSKASNLQESDLMSEKHQDKARSLKRDDSKDRLSAIRGESPVKRPRQSETPPRSGMQEVAIGYDNGGPQKRRRLEGDSKAGPKADSTPSSSPDQRTSTKRGVSHEKSTTKPNVDMKEKDKSAHSSQKRIESPERRRNRNPSDETESSKIDRSGSAKSIKLDATENAALLALKAEEEREAQRLREKEKEAQLRREKEEREAREKAELDEKMERERIEEARQARLAREQAAREEELKRQQEESERKERQRREDAAAHAREQDRQKALYLEQERQRKEEQDRRRAQMLEQQRAERIRIEKEKRIERLAKLPLLLRWLDMEADPRTPQIATLFRFIEGFRYDTIRPEATGLPNGREQWMLNTQVALLLGEKDLQLSRCKSY
jgi:ankyrin repeat protein